ncbi:MAG: 3'(2'),5'-bisphosphate nucleotidase CysQ [Acidimicrobiia bacterium]|nr:3'(2'),5'-bisphosphate nucleotidase CysQ [Acidimicrobiia bacterium]
MPAAPADHHLAAELALLAGYRLLGLRAEGGGGDHVGARGDRAADDLLVTALRRARPRDGLLTEESVDDGRRLEHERVWIVDPLDGTREFSEPGRADWAVHVALTEGGAPVAGAVALPARDLVLSTVSPVPVPPGRDGPPRLVVSRSRPPAIAAPVAEDLHAEVVELGSAGAKAMAVVLGDAEVYLHAGGMYEWDSCAPVAVALHAGLHCSRIDGRPLRYNNPDPLLPDLLVCRPELALAALEAVARAGGARE